MRRGLSVVCLAVLALPLQAQRPVPERLPSGERPVLRSPYRIQLPADPLFIGSWHRLPVQLGALAIEDVEFRVSEGPVGGFVSPSIDETFDPARPHIVFGAGWRPGSFRLEMRRRNDQSLLASAKYEVTRERKGLDGPSLWLQGRTNDPSRGANGAAWGGGAPGVQIENYAFQRAPATWRVAAILVDTSSERYSDDEADDTRTTWREEALDGSTGPEPGRSVREFYDEVSFGNTTMNVDFYGPVSLDGSWADYFRDGEETNGPNFAGMWFAKPEFHQAVGSAAQDDVDFEEYDSVLSIVRSVDGGTRFAWPLAQNSTFPKQDDWFGGTVSRKTISMPHNWGSGVRPTRRIYQTLAHELGHNLGLPDLYTPEVDGRNVGGWDMMDADSQFPYFSLGNRLLLGWVPPNLVKPINFAFLPPGQPINEPVLLSPVTNGAPAQNRFVGVEMRIGNGHNYYLEYRRAQGGQSGDQNLPADDRLVLTDMMSPEVYTPPSERPVIMMAVPDAGDGPVLANGEEYHEQDSSPVQAHDFRIEAVQVGDNQAEVWVKYEVQNPDPSIRPWPASQDRQYQSPDILVRNERNASDPSWTNCPWEDHDNTIEATIRNDTMADAPEVTVDFFEQSFNLGFLPGERRDLGSVTHDVNHGEAVTFAVNWVPRDTGHKCIQVSIRGYKVPDANILESSPLNNFAQSNYTRFISASSSPPRRQRLFLTVSNPYRQATFFLLDGQQTNPLYRTYLAHSYVWLRPNEVRQIEVLSEYADEAIAESAAAVGQAGDYRKQRPIWIDRPNLVHVRGWIVEPKDPHVLHPFGGVDIEVAQGKATRFVDLKPGNDGVTGRVEDSAGKPVPGGRVLATLWSGSGRQRRERTFRTPLDKGGTFRLGFKDPWQTLELYFLPPPGYGDATERFSAGR